jgi:hypothetical protein
VEVRRKLASTQHSIGERRRVYRWKGGETNLKYGKVPDGSNKFGRGG